MFLNFLKKYKLRKLYSADQIVYKMSNFYPTDNFKEYDAIKITDLPNQQVLIISTFDKIYCVIDVRLNFTPTFIWGIKKETVTEVDTIDLPYGIGILKINGQPFRKYQTKLFSEDELKLRIEKMINHNKSY